MTFQSEIPTRIQWQSVHLWSRLAHAKQILPPVPTDLRVVFEDDKEPDLPAQVLIPDPHWLAMALHGNILPPISAYLTMPLLQVYECSGVLREIATTGHAAARIRWNMKRDGWLFVGEKVDPSHTLHTSETLPAMTMRQAIEYLLMKDIPSHVWQSERRQNTRNIVICTATQLPASRAARNAWRLTQ